MPWLKTLADSRASRVLRSARVRIRVHEPEERTVAIKRFGVTL
jgi:hypothetical protein